MLKNINLCLQKFENQLPLSYQTHCYLVIRFETHVYLFRQPYGVTQFFKQSPKLQTEIYYGAFLPL